MTSLLTVILMSVTVFAAPRGNDFLQKKILSEDLPLKTRWMSVMNMDTKKDEDRLFLKDLLNHTTWFLRSAALKQLHNEKDPEAFSSAQRLLSKDKSLLVRAAALEVYLEYPQKKRSYLWKQLENPRNSLKGRSLSLRKQIFMHLAKKPVNYEMPLFRRISQEKSDLQPLAKAVVEQFQSRAR